MSRNLTFYAFLLSSRSRQISHSRIWLQFRCFSKCNFNSNAHSLLFFPKNTEKLYKMAAFISTWNFTWLCHVFWSRDCQTTCFDHVVRWFDHVVKLVWWVMTCSMHCPRGLVAIFLSRGFASLTTWSGSYFLITWFCITDHVVWQPFSYHVVLRHFPCSLFSAGRSILSMKGMTLSILTLSIIPLKKISSRLSALKVLAAASFSSSLPILSHIINKIFVIIAKLSLFLSL